VKYKIYAQNEYCNLFNSLDD